MTDRINSITVVLDKDYRDDDCKHIINAIKMIKGVIKAKPNVVDHSDYVAHERARTELWGKIFDVFNDKKQ